MITTVTMNAAMDRALVVPNFLVGRRHRASNGITLPGGHGVTVARAARRLGSPVIASGLAGGLTGENIVERLTSEGILNDFVRITEPSRTSTAVIDPVSGVHTEINERGPRVRPEEVDLVLEKLRYLARASRCVVLAGTLPREVDADLYQRMLRLVQNPERTMVTVVTGPDDPEVLRAALSAEPTVAIVEQREAEALVGHEFGGDDDVLVGLDELGRMGAQSVLVTHDTGCYARVREGRGTGVSISYHFASHDPVEATSELGVTDSFVAGYVHSLLNERPLHERLKFAVAVSLANRRELGAGVFDKGDAVRLQREVTVRQLEQPVEVEGL